MQPPPPLRDRLIRSLAKCVRSDRITDLQYEQVAMIDNNTKYIEVRNPAQGSDNCGVCDPFSFKRADNRCN